MPRPEDHWTLDKRVPLALIGVLIGQIVGFGWMASKMDSRIESLEQKAGQVEIRMRDSDRDAREANARLIRLEEKFTAMLDIMRRVERAVEPPPRRGDVQ